MTQPDVVVTVREAATRLALSERTIRQMLADGRLPRVRLLGVRAVRIPVAAVKAMTQTETPAIA